MERLADACVVLRERETHDDFVLDCGDAGALLGWVVDPHDGQSLLAYRSDLLDVGFVAGFAARLVDFGERLFADPARTLQAVPLLSPTAAAAVRAETCPRLTPSAAVRDVAQWFAQIAALRADHVAIEDSQGRVLTYRELDEASRRVAHWLQAGGHGVESRIALQARSQLDWFVAMLGIVRAGACYVPVDPDYPAERRHRMLAIASCDLLVDEGDDQASGGAHSRIALADLMTAAAALPLQALPEHPLPASSVAYLMFTSGSTGLPKGVAVTRSALAGYVDAASRAYGISESDRMLQQSSMSFDIATEEIFLPLLTGSTLVLYPPERELSVTVFEDYLRTRRISVTTIPTAYWHVWAAAETIAPHDNSLRLLITGGEAPSATVLKKWRQRWPATDWVNSYGPTETTVIAALWHAGDMSSLREAGPVSAGSAIDGVLCVICDENGDVLPPGATGELLIGGSGLARGYWGDPAATAAQFVPDPWGNNGERLYRSGDLARYRADGMLEIIGRADRQVKLRGFRIEPDEVAEQLKRVDGVRDACVFVTTDSVGNRRLAACWVGSGLDAGTIRSALAARLPEYMVPERYLELAAIPLTPAGKRDLTALALAVEESARGAVTVEPPQTEREQALLAVWQGLLGDVPLGRNSHFFNSGGHSLLAVRLCHGIKLHFAVDLPVLDVFRAPLLSQMAHRIDELQAARSVLLSDAVVDDEEMELFQI
jgi:amino acid adenylation domain-containing protein